LIRGKKEGYGKILSFQWADIRLNKAMPKKPVVLIIRDGWGRNPLGPSVAEQFGDATVLASTPFTDKLLEEYPHSLIGASGDDVGLPDGQMGNSEVGHLNLGAGRVVFQDLCRISNAIKDGSLASNPVLVKACEQAKTARLHLLGLVSDGGVHSHIDHLIGLVRIAYEAGVRDICIHAITDGRDCSPTSGSSYLKQLEEAVAPYGAKIATVIGRFYAMDRDKRWDRNKLAWDAIVLGRGEQCTCTPHEYIEKRYAENETDEFLKPGIFAYGNEQRVRDEDVVFFFNFRADRARQISEAFLYPEFDGFDREVQPKVHYVTMTEYDAKYPSPIVFEAEQLNNILGQIVADAGLKQLRIAETEKYAHVTFFFNGGVETQFEGEDRILVPSPREVATYDLKPQMSAASVAEKFVEAIGNYDVAILNFANPDMVGHTGFVEAAVKACEAVDQGLQQVVSKVLELGGKLLITADHGNCEHMRNEDGSPNTAHTTNLVDLIYVGADKDSVKLDNGILADIAPTMLALLGIDKPAEMSGHSLVSPK
jgi:2,3-bisphosphoglycerate-independent phosphoglycerate mutase